MPTHADNYTARMRGNYVANGIPHVMKVRLSASSAAIVASPDTFADEMNNYVLSFEAQLSTDWAWTGWAYALIDSDIWVPFNPVLSDTVAGALDHTDFSPMVRISACAHSGRAAGSKARIYWWGPLINMSASADVGGDGILSATDCPGLPAATTFANATFRAGNGEPAIFYERFTYKPNDDLLKLVRRGVIV